MDRDLDSLTSVLAMREHDVLVFWYHHPDMFVVFDERGVFERVSPACRDILGYEPEELQGHSYTEFIHPDDLNAAAAEVEVASTEASRKSNRKIREFYNHYVRKDGTLVHLLWESVTSQHGKYYSIAREVAGRS